MNWLKGHGSYAIAIAVIGSFMVSFANAGDNEKKVRESIKGEWKISSRVLSNEEDGRMSNAIVVLGDKEELEIRFATGEVQTIRFAPVVHDVKNKILRFMIENDEDSAANGGGGARKGICRINDKGEMEMMETTSSVDDFPIDFSEKSKSVVHYWKLIRQPVKK
jgi:hypothetical protein